MPLKAATLRHTPECPRGDGTTMAMAERPTSYEYEDLLTCGRGELFGKGNAQLPLPPMLMFDRITEISETGGEFGKGVVRAELDVMPGVERTASREKRAFASEKATEDRFDVRCGELAGRHQQALERHQVVGRLSVAPPA